MGDIVNLPHGIVRGSKPDSLAVVWTANGWTIQFAQKDRPYGSRYFLTREAATTEAERLVAKHGLAWPARKISASATPPEVA